MPAESQPSRHAAWLFLGLAAGVLLLAYLIFPVPFARLGQKAGMGGSAIGILFAPQIFLVEHWSPYRRWTDWQDSWFRHSGFEPTPGP